MDSTFEERREIVSYVTFRDYEKRVSSFTTPSVAQSLRTIDTTMLER